MGMLHVKDLLEQFGEVIQWFHDAGKKFNDNIVTIIVAFNGDVLDFGCFIAQQS